MVTVRQGDADITLLGTAHVSRASAEQVEQLLASGEYDAVAVELCPSRHHAIVNPDALARMDLFRVIREGKAAMVAASLALSAFQQRLADQFGIEPGAEMRAALQAAAHRGLPVILIDRELGITLRRIYRNIPWWRRYNLLGGLLASLVSREQITEAQIEQLKEGDMLETTFAQFAEQQQELYVPLIDERDRYMTARLQDSVAQDGHRHVLAVIGAGHLRGMQRYLEQSPEKPPQEIIRELDAIPRASRWVKLIPWLIVALILAGFALGFSQSSQIGWSMVIDWIVISGGLAAVGTLIAGGHPVTVLGAFLAAPLTTLNPAVGVGMVTAAIEMYFRKPTVEDFTRLRTTAAHLKGWWRNRVTRTLLVFIFSSLGAALGMYVAGYKIYERLTAG